MKEPLGAEEAHPGADGSEDRHTEGAYSSSMVCANEKASADIALMMFFSPGCRPSRQVSEAVKRHEEQKDRNFTGVTIHSPYQR